MKATLIVMVIFAAIAVAYSLPAVDGGMDLGDGYNPGQWMNTATWMNPAIKDFLMCKMKCRQSCIEQGFWNGYCKPGAPDCMCVGPFGPFGTTGRVNELPMF